MPTQNWQNSLNLYIIYPYPLSFSKSCFFVPIFLLILENLTATLFLFTKFCFSRSAPLFPLSLSQASTVDTSITTGQVEASQLCLEVAMPTHKLCGIVVGLPLHSLPKLHIRDILKRLSSFHGLLPTSATCPEFLLSFASSSPVDPFQLPWPLSWPAYSLQWDPAK